MYVRLAFAVAAHLETEILLVDEVLAVGDLEFQEKCLGKMQSVTRDGRTVLLVSHNLQSIRELSDSCILLEQGTVRAAGPVPDVLDEYRALATDAWKLRVASASRELSERRNSLSSGNWARFRLHAARLSS